MIWIQTMSTVLITQRARLEMVPTSQIRVVVKQMEQIFLFLHHRCRREKNSYTLSKSQLLYEATTSIGIGREKKTRQKFRSFFFWFLGKMLSLVLRIVHWVDKDALGIGTLTVGCTTLELPHVFPLKSFDQKISIF